METRKVFEKSIQYGNEISKKHKEMQEIARNCVKLWDDCEHEIVFKYNDSHPRMLIIDGYYFCPACGHAIEMIDEDGLKESSFKDSKVISLSNLSLIESKELYKAIRYEVYNNYDFYYDLSIPVEEKQIKMETALKEFDVEYTPASKRLIKYNKGKRK